MTTSDSYEKQAGLLDNRDEDSEPYCTPKEAADYLGVTPQAFEGIRKSYGIGRYHQPRDHDQIVYSMNDLDRIKLTIQPSAPAVG